MKISKYILIVVLTITSFTSNSQVEVQIKNKAKFGTVSCSVELQIDRNTRDTSFIARLHFPNFKDENSYGGVISFWKVEERDEFLMNLERCIPYMEEESQNFSAGIFEIHDGAKALFINSRNGDYTFLSKTNTLKLRDWVKSIELR
jgi:hypothetical protein|tara:strand:+ start:1348 stop:1785 length:438 start_codon:yes stop_codon:yes gene_type:complete